MKRRIPDEWKSCTSRTLSVQWLCSRRYGSRGTGLCCIIYYTIEQYKMLIALYLCSGCQSAKFSFIIGTQISHTWILNHKCNFENCPLKRVHMFASRWTRTRLKICLHLLSHFLCHYLWTFLSRHNRTSFREFVFFVGQKNSIKMKFHFILSLSVWVTLKLL